MFWMLSIISEEKLSASTMTLAPAALAWCMASTEAAVMWATKNHWQSSKMPSPSSAKLGGWAVPRRYTMLLPLVSRSLSTMDREVVSPSRTFIPLTSMPWRSKSRMQNCP